MKKAKEEERDARLFQQWVVQLPAMGMSGAYMSFDAYKDHVTGANIDRRPALEILRELDEIEKQFEEGGNP